MTIPPTLGSYCRVRAQLAQQQEHVSQSSKLSRGVRSELRDYMLAHGIHTASGTSGVARLVPPPSKCPDDAELRSIICSIADLDADDVPAQIAARVTSAIHHRRRNSEPSRWRLRLDTRASTTRANPREASQACRLVDDAIVRDHAHRRVLDQTRDDMRAKRRTLGTMEGEALRDLTQQGRATVQLRPSDPTSSAPPQTYVIRSSTIRTRRPVSCRTLADVVRSQVRRLLDAGWTVADGTESVADAVCAQLQALRAPVATERIVLRRS